MIWNEIKNEIGRNDVCQIKYWKSFQIYISDMWQCFSTSMSWYLQHINTKKVVIVYKFNWYLICVFAKSGNHIQIQISTKVNLDFLPFAIEFAIFSSCTECHVIVYSSTKKNYVYHFSVQDGTKLNTFQQNSQVDQDKYVFIHFFLPMNYSK